MGNEGEEASIAGQQNTFIIDLTGCVFVCVIDRQILYINYIEVSYFYVLIVFVCLHAHCVCVCV